MRLFPGLFLWALVVCLGCTACSKSDSKPAVTVDTLILKNGGKIEGQIQSETPEKIVLKYQDGLIDFKPSEVQQILRGQAGVKNKSGIEVAGGDPTLKNYPRLRLRTGRSKYGVKLTKHEGVFLLEKHEGSKTVVDKYPEDQIEGAYLWPEPEEEVLNDAFRREINARRKELETRPPYFILSDVESSDLVLYRNALERLFNDFLTQLFDILDIENHPVKGFAVKLYGNQKEFLATIGAGPDSMILGYFLPDTRVLHLYNIRQVEMLNFWMGKREHIEKQIADLKSKISESRSDADSGKWQVYDKLEKIQYESETQRTQLEFYARQQTIQTIRHEATHQLLFHFGVDSKEVHRGAWLSEGVAEYFGMETAGADNEMRLMDIRYDLDHGHQLIPLYALMQYANAGGAHHSSDQNYTLLIYAESWAFIDFLMKNYKPGFMNYLREIQTEKSGFDAKEDVALLERHVGKTLQALDKEFDPFVKEMLGHIDEDIYLRYQNAKFKAAK